MITTYKSYLLFENIYNKVVNAGLLFDLNYQIKSISNAVDSLNFINTDYYKIKTFKKSDNSIEIVIFAKNNSLTRCKNLTFIVDNKMIGVYCDGDVNHIKNIYVDSYLEQNIKAEIIYWFTK